MLKILAVIAGFILLLYILKKLIIRKIKSVLNLNSLNNNINFNKHSKKSEVIYQKDNITVLKGDSDS